MSLLVGRLILLGLIASLPACMIVNDFKENLHAYERPEGPLPYRHSSSELMVTWNTVRRGNDTVVEGFITNVHRLQVQNISLDVQVTDSNGRALSTGSDLLPQNTLYMNDSLTFSVQLKDVRMTEGNVLKFYINYRTRTGAWGGGSGDCNFKVDAATGTVIKEQTAQSRLQG
jgi:hypothetical protein